MSELLYIQPVTLTTPVQQIVSRNGVRVNGVACGEEIINEREVVREGRPYCPTCAAPAYYAPEELLFVVGHALVSQGSRR